MENENQKLFDSVSGNEFETSNDVQKNINEFDSAPVEQEDNMVAPPQNIQNDFEIGDMSSKPKKEVKLKEDEQLEEVEIFGRKIKVTVKEYIIEDASLTVPVTRDVDGNFIEPKVFNEKQPDKKGYIGKLKITYKESDYISLLPNIKWYVGKLNPQTGKRSLNPWFLTEGLDDERMDDRFVSEISKLYYKFCKKFGYTSGKLPASQFIKELAGKKVKLTQWKTNYEGSDRYRIDIAMFV